jgi:hypothetical protein
MNGHNYKNELIKILRVINPQQKKYTNFHLSWKDEDDIRTGEAHREQLKVGWRKRCQH